MRNEVDLPIGDFEETRSTCAGPSAAETRRILINTLSLIRGYCAVSFIFSMLIWILMKPIKSKRLLIVMNHFQLRKIMTVMQVRSVGLRCIFNIFELQPVVARGIFFILNLIFASLANHPLAAQSLIEDDSLQLLVQMVANGSLTVFSRHKESPVLLHSLPYL
ncbi:uncharacterized protein LOC126589591 isoform X2 [Malus sylvestris]|nr:uncharacterized protein LOC126589591 isoform X2 [Malus sylvestris]